MSRGKKKRTEKVVEYKTISFTVHECGYATLYGDGEIIQEVDYSKGYEKVMQIFNSLMIKRQLSYRLTSSMRDVFNVMKEAQKESEEVEGNK